MHFPHFLLAQERKFPAENQVPGGLYLLSNLLCWHQASTELGGDHQEGTGPVVVGREKDGAADGNLRGGSFPLDLPLIISGTRDPLHFPEALFMGIAALGAYGALPASSKGSGHLLPHQEQPQGMKAEGLTAPPAPHQPYHTGSGSILTACTPQSRRTTLPKPRHCVCAPVWAVPPSPEQGWSGRSQKQDVLSKSLMKLPFTGSTEHSCSQGQTSFSPAPAAGYSAAQNPQSPW